MTRQIQERFGIGEWYGRSFTELTPEERQGYAELQFLKSKDRPEQPCRPRMRGTEEFVPCTKAGGVCTLRQYRRDNEREEVTVAPGQRGTLRTTCPYRFEEAGIAFQWIAETLLGHADPLVVGEVGFLQPVSEEEQNKRSAYVGYIDNILVHPNADPLKWCALEVQSVYFSGTSMRKEFGMLREADAGLPFPAGYRRPDYRSSGPKRLMPQLQIKIPSLRRWGKKMAVLIDEGFYHALGKMDQVEHISNCDIAWFVVRYDESSEEACLEPGFVQFTTLERAVEGLTAGVPVSQQNFEGRIREKMVDQL